MTFRSPLPVAAGLALALGAAAPAFAQTTVTIGIGTQDTTTNTVTTGVVIRELKLLEKYLPRTASIRTSRSSWTGRTSPPARPSPTA